MFVDSTSYFDVELKSLKKISTASVSRIADIVKQQDETEERLFSLLLYFSLLVK